MKPSRILLVVFAILLSIGPRGDAAILDRGGRWHPQLAAPRNGRR